MCHINFVRTRHQSYQKCSDLDLFEQKTRGQASCRLWFDHRQGRLTASSFGEVLSCQSGNSTKALVRRLCEQPRQGKGSLPAPLQCASAAP